MDNNIDKTILTFLNKENLLYFNGFLFNNKNKSYYGYRIDLLKSALQKYLRRREKNKMVWVICELYMFNFASEKGYVVLSNVVNRIKIFLDEEMCFDDWERYLKVMELLEEFENNNKKRLDILVKICYILLDCNMIRLNSDIKSYYKIAIDKYKLKISECIGDINNANFYIKKGDSDNNIILFSKFIELFENNNVDCFYYAIKLVDNEEKGEKGGVRFRRKGCSYILWEYLVDEGKKKNNDNLIKVLNYKLKEYYKKRCERIIFLTAAISLLLYYNDIDWNNKIDFNKYNVNVLELIESRKNMEIDSYCMDMHCKEGRDKGMNKIDFVMEGALVVDEYKKYYNEDWRNLYKEIGVDYVKNNIKNKKKVSKKKNKINNIEYSLDFIDFNEFKNIKLCTNITCGNKVMCVFALYNGEYVCLKEGRKSMNYNRDYCVVDSLKKDFNLNEIGMYRIRSNKIIVKKDKKIKSWKDNWCLENKDDVVYCVMNVIENAKEIGYFKNNLNDEMLYEFLKIGVFRYIFKVTDFNIRNVLVDENNNLYSIDEGSLGKKKDIWGNKNKKYVKKLFKKDKGLYDKMLDEICENMENRKEKIVSVMKVYCFNDDEIKNVIDNYENIRNVVNNELNKLVN